MVNGKSSSLDAAEPGNKDGYASARTTYSIQSVPPKANVQSKRNFTSITRWTSDWDDSLLDIGKVLRFSQPIETYKWLAMTMIAGLKLFIPWLYVS